MHTFTIHFVAGIPLNAEVSFGFQVPSLSHKAKVMCNEEANKSATNLSSCTISLSPAVSKQQAGVRCFQSSMYHVVMTAMVIALLHYYSDSCRDGETRIINEVPVIEEQEATPDDSTNHTLSRREVMNAQRVIEGRVEVCFQNVWGAIYDQNFTNKDAAVACQQLGYGRYGNIS